MSLLPDFNSVFVANKSSVNIVCCNWHRGHQLRMKIFSFTKKTFRQFILRIVKNSINEENIFHIFHRIQNKFKSFIFFCCFLFGVDYGKYSCSIQAKRNSWLHKFIQNYVKYIFVQHKCSTNCYLISINLKSVGHNSVSLIRCYCTPLQAP